MRSVPLLELAKTIGAAACGFKPATGSNGHRQFRACFAGSVVTVAARFEAGINDWQKSRVQPDD